MSWIAVRSDSNLGPAKNHPWMLTTLGCPELLTRGIPQSISFRGLPEVGLTIPVGSAQRALNRWIAQLRNFSAEEFLGSGVLGHPRVVSIQGWWGSKGGSWPARESPRWPVCSDVAIARFDPKDPKIVKNRDLEIFKRDCTSQASHPPNPYFGGNSGQDWNFLGRLKISSEIDFFQSLGP